MTDETLAEHKARYRAELIAAFGPAEAAQMAAKDEAIQAQVEDYERELAQQLVAIEALKQTDDGGHMLTRIASVIALEQLRCAALGCAEPTWEQALRRHRVLWRATIEAIKPTFQRETN